MGLNDQEKKILNAVREVFFKARLIDSENMAALGLSYAQLVDKLTKPSETKE